ncbi:DDE-domain-containing protein, partial [Aulographum hederae CBS 113979]
DGHGSHVTDKFMYMAWQNKVYITYLPAHTSHITQPLDISIFGPLKTRYHQAVDGLRSLDDDSIVKKRNFVSIYTQARIQAITEANRRAGFRGAGIVPYNPSKVLDNPQIKAIEPKTPNTTLSQPNQAMYTKRKSSDLVGLSDRDARSVVKDYQQEIDTKNTEIAALQQQLELYKQTVGDVQSRKRKRIKPAPNSRFIEQDLITERVQEAQEAQAREQARNAPSGLKIRLRFGAETIQNQI